MVRKIDVADITRNIKEMCIEANHFLSGDMAAAMEEADGEGASGQADFVPAAG